MNKIVATYKSFPKRCVAFGTAALLAASFLLPTATHAAASTATMTKCGVQDVQCVITIGDTLFTNRQTVLQKLQTEVTTLQEKKNLTDAQANNILNNLSTNLNDITTLKNTMDSEKTALAARKDIRQLYSQYRIFAVVVPRDSREIHLAVESNVQAKLVTIEPNLEHLIAKAPAANQAQLNTLYSDYKDKVVDARTNIDNAQDVLPDITVNNFDNNHGIFEASLKKLNDNTKQASADIHGAVADLHQLRQQLKLDNN